MFRAFGLAIIYLSAHTADSRLMRKVLMNFTPPSGKAVQNEPIQTIHPPLLSVSGCHLYAGYVLLWRRYTGV